MCTAEEQFRDHYADRLSSGISNFLESYGQQVIGKLQAAVRRQRNTIYLFGNGGSHAISKCFEYALQSFAASQRLSIRIQTGIDTHKGTTLSEMGSPGACFVDVLNVEGADADDLIVLISGSGDSDNLCDVAEYARSRQLPIIGLLGSGGGKLSGLLPRQSRFAIPSVDQQISEDIIQSLACIMETRLQNYSLTRWNRLIGATKRELYTSIRAIPPNFLIEIANSIVEAFFSRKFVWVFGIDHPALSACAEHVAHNLFWDGIYEVCNPPPRFVFSSPTACNFSGISNDRREGAIELSSGISNFETPGVAVLYSMSSDRSQLTSLLSQLSAASVHAYLVYSNGQVPVGGEYLAGYRTNIQKPQLQALFSQALGHMLGRLVRLRLIERNGSNVWHDFGARDEFLIRFDLAQRRLIDA